MTGRRKVLATEMVQGGVGADEGVGEIVPPQHDGLAVGAVGAAAPQPAAAGAGLWRASP